MAMNKTYTSIKKGYEHSHILAIYKINKIISRCVYHMYQAKNSAHFTHTSLLAVCKNQ